LFIIAKNLFATRKRYMEEKRRPVAVVVSEDVSESQSTPTRSLTEELPPWLIPVEIPKPKQPEHSYVPFEPPGVTNIHGRAMLTMPVNVPVMRELPPLLYKLDGAYGGDCKISMSVTFESDSYNPIQFDVRMANYVSLDERKIMKDECCLECDKYNQKADRHNDFIAALLTTILKTNACQVSAGKVLHEAKPNTSASEQRMRIVTAYKTNKVILLKDCTNYLWKELNIAPYEHYDYEDATILSDIISYFAKAHRKAMKIAAGKRSEMNIRGGGYLPSKWNGADMVYMESNPTAMYCWYIPDEHCCKYNKLVPAVFEEAKIWPCDIGEQKAVRCFPGDKSAICSFSAFEAFIESYFAEKWNIQETDDCEEQNDEKIVKDGIYSNRIQEAFTEAYKRIGKASEPRNATHVVCANIVYAYVYFDETTNN